jgi:hypothetical protein
VEYGLGLAETLRALRQEISEAMAEGQGQSVRMGVESIDLQMQIAVTREATAGGRARFWVLEAGGKLTDGSVATHTVALHLTAETADGERVLTGNRDDGARARTID